MSIVVINALSVPEGQAEELEARFAARKNAVDQAPGCLQQPGDLGVICLHRTDTTS